MTVQRQTRGERSRRELTEVAIDCFSQHGFQGTSIDRIARLAGVTKGAIYYHFRDKEELILAAVTDRVAAFESRVQKACEGVDPPEALRCVAEVCIRHAVRGDHPRFAIKLMVESIDTNPRVAEEMRGMLRRFRAFLRNIVRDGQERGLLRADVDAGTVAASYVASVLGAEVQFYLDPDRVGLEQTLAAYLEQLGKDLAPNVCVQTAATGRDRSPQEKKER
jgi:AcrR family transcriptional regulator